VTVKGKADPLLHWVVSRSLVVGVVVVLGSLAYGEVAVTLGVALGAVLALANFWALRWLMNRVLDRAAGGGRARVGALLPVKLGALAALVYLILNKFPVHPIALTVGLSVVVVVILAGPVLGPPLEAATEE
jgi:hypothetical protein